MSASAVGWDRFGVLYARLALGAAFLSAVASRFGLWSGEPGLEHFRTFMKHTADVNSFMPSMTVPFLAWMATAAELSLGWRSSSASRRDGSRSAVRCCWRCSAQPRPSRLASSRRWITRRSPRQQRRCCWRSLRPRNGSREEKGTLQWVVIA